MVIGQKYYVISLYSDGTHQVEVCSGVNEVILRCSSILCNESRSSLFIDVGFLWPQVKDILKILQKNLGEIIISQYASNALSEIPVCYKVASYFEANAGEDVPVLLVDQKFSRGLFCDPSLLLTFCPEWVLESKFSDLTELSVKIRDKLTLYQIDRIQNLLGYFSEHALSYLKHLDKKDLASISKAIIKHIKRGVVSTEVDTTKVKSQIELPNIENIDISASTTLHSDEEILFDAPDSSNLLFEEWLKTADLQDPIKILEHSPEWVLELDASTLVNIPARLKNRLEGQEVAKVEDLLKHSSNSILKWPDIGRKSLAQLSTSIIATVAAGQTVGLKGDEPATLATTSLQNLFNNALNTLTSREADVLRMRLGYNLNKSMTLEEIGRKFSVSRERIRQIEAKAKKKLQSLPLWRDKIIETKVIDLMLSRVEPCYLDLISIDDDWFAGFSRNTKCLGALIEDACNKKIKSISIGDRDVISRIDGESWRHAKLEVISILEARLSSQLTEEDVLLLIESYLGKYEAQELTSTLFNVISSQLHFVSTENSGGELASIGKGANSVVLAVLKASDTPLHYSEAHSRCLKKGYEIDIRRVHNALSDISSLFSLGTYGLRKHLKITKVEEEEILSLLEDIILSGDSERQWNSAVLVEQLCHQLPSTSEVIDKYAVNIILENSELLTYLGRFIWIRNEHAKKQNISRIDLQEAATALIEKKGRSMSTREIKTQIMKQRGMGEYFSLKVTKLLTRTSPNVWGLVNRDFYLTSQQIKLLLDILYKALLDRNKGLYIDEAIFLLNECGVHLPAKLSDYMIFSIAQTDSRFTIKRGQILALSEWDDARLMTIREASFQAASELQEFKKTNDLRSRIEELIGRKFSENNQFIEGIRDAGFVYHELKHKWLREFWGHNT